MAAASDDSLRQLAFDNAAQANIISNVSNGQIIMANPAACKLLGYSKKMLLTKKRAAIFDIRETSFKKMLKQRTAEGHSIALVTVIKKSGKLLPCEITSAVFMDEDGIEKSITSIADMSQHILAQKNVDAEKEKVVAADIVLARVKQKNIDIKKEKIVASNIRIAKVKSNKEKLSHGIAAREQLLTEYESSFKLFFNSSSDVLYDVDLLTEETIFNHAYEQEFGYKITGNMEVEDDWFDHIHPDDKEAVVKDYHRMLASAEIEWKNRFRFLKADSSVANVITGGIVLRNATGRAYRRIGYMQDISKQKVVEERLEKEIRLKEIQIAEAMEDAKETERSDIGKELHDNINQLLSVSKLYLDMAKRGGENSEIYLSRSSEYTISAIEEIRKLSKGLTTDMIKNIGLCDAIVNVIHDTMEVNPVKISCSLKSFIEDSVSNKFKLAVFRIVQEELNNVLKHAKATKVIINLSQNKKSIVLTIADNGIGFDTGKKRKGIGMDNIKSRAESYNGSADFVSRPQQGCVLTVTFPVADALLHKN